MKEGKIDMMDATATTGFCSPARRPVRVRRDRSKIHLVQCPVLRRTLIQAVAMRGEWEKGAPSGISGHQFTIREITFSLPLTPFDAANNALLCTHCPILPIVSVDSDASLL